MVKVQHKELDYTTLQVFIVRYSTLSAEAQYSINFSRSNRKLCSNLYYNGSNSFLLVNATKICEFRAKDSEIKIYSLRLGNTSKDFSANNMKKKTGLNGCVYNFSVDYSTLILVILSISLSI